MKAQNKVAALKFYDDSPVQGKTTMLRSHLKNYLLEYSVERVGNGKVVKRTTANGNIWLVHSTVELHARAKAVVLAKAPGRLLSKVTIEDIVYPQLVQDGVQTTKEVLLFLLASHRPDNNNTTVQSAALPQVEERTPLPLTTPATNPPSGMLFMSPYHHQQGSIFRSQPISRKKKIQIQALRQETRAKRDAAYASASQMRATETSNFVDRNQQNLLTYSTTVATITTENSQAREQKLNLDSVSLQQHTQLLEGDLLADEALIMAPSFDSSDEDTPKKHAQRPMQLNFDSPTPPRLSNGAAVQTTEYVSDKADDDGDEDDCTSKETSTQSETTDEASLAEPNSTTTAPTGGDDWLSKQLVTSDANLEPAIVSEDQDPRALLDRFKASFGARGAGKSIGRSVLHIQQQGNFMDVEKNAICFFSDNCLDPAVGESANASDSDQDRSDALFDAWTCGLLLYHPDHIGIRRGRHCL